MIGVSYHCSKTFASGGKRFPTSDDLIIQALILLEKRKFSEVNFYVGLATWQKPVYIGKINNKIFIKVKNISKNEWLTQFCHEKMTIEKRWRHYIIIDILNKINFITLAHFIGEIYKEYYNCNGVFKLKAYLR